jgi:mannan endo-1,4-beta-mannosidase
MSSPKKTALLLLVVLAAALVAVISFVHGRGSGSPERTAPPTTFVSVQNGRFVLEGRPYRFAGGNFWQGMNMGARAPIGDRKRLVAELKRMRRLGITNLRVLALSQGPNTEPYRVTPALETSPGVYDKRVLDGLDFLLAQIRKNGMTAVMVLNNYWQWSGGMAQYVSWSDGSPIPYPNQTGGWNRFMTYSDGFYDCAECRRWYRNDIHMLVEHVNAYTHQKYRNDPAIFSWELANEPRSYPDAWIDDTASYIKSLDPNHMVTTGSEGAPPGEGDDFAKTHDDPDIDYATIHIWPQNWGFFDPAHPSSYESAERMALGYLSDREDASAKLGKPLVLEEFGLARDWKPLHDVYDPRSTTTYRDRYYRALYAAVEQSVSSDGPLQGDNFWAWAGKARPGSRWIGDPPHEKAGWYSVYDADGSTLSIISAHARRLEGR